MSAKIYTLTAVADVTDWMDLAPWAAGAIEFQGVLPAGNTIVLETSNDNAGTPANLDLVIVGTYTGNFASVLQGPLANKCRVRKTLGTTACFVSFGRGLDGKGNSGQVVRIGYTAGGPSSDLFVP